MGFDSKVDTVAIIGVGLLGGSLALALKKRQLVSTVIGLGRNQEKLEKAKSIGAIDQYFLDWEEGLRQADFIVLAVPIFKIAEILNKIKPYIKSEALITDVGSTKSYLIDQVLNDQVLNSHFIGSHPMAGSEKTGVEYSDSDLFVGRTVVVTPNDDHDEKKIRLLTKLWESVGAIVLNLKADVHDHIVALTSHLPHVLAFAMSTLLKEEDNQNNHFYRVYGQGLLDSTRIAASDAEIWKDIILSNKFFILHSLEKLKKILDKMESLIKSDHASDIIKFINAASSFRKELDHKN